MTLSRPTTPPAKSGARRANALPSYCMLDEYRIEMILGAGGFGVTYKALDTHLENRVAIKEYFPVEWSFRDSDGVTVHPNAQGDANAADESLTYYWWGLERFLDEARVLARIQHPGVVRIKRYFRAHGTAYIVMDYEEGQPLSAILRDGETLGEDEVRGVLADVLPALQAVHEHGYLHRDIKPSNLYLRSSDHRVILIDFGAAREAVGRHSKSVTSLVTPGYSPPEQYMTRTDRYGACTDIYALGAVLYRCITGRSPIEAAERLLDDTLEPAVRAGAGRYSASLLQVIDRALAVRPEQRFAHVADLQAALTEAPDETSDHTVIMLPTIKPGRTAPPPHPLPTQPKRAWQLPAALAGGGALMATAATIVWLSWSEPAIAPEPPPEPKPPPRYSLGQEASPPVLPTPVAAPALNETAVSPPLPVEATTTVAPPVPPPPEPAPVEETLEEPRIAETDQLPADQATPEVPPDPSAADRSAAPLPVIAPVAPTGQMAPAAARASEKPQARRAPPKRPPRKRTPRKPREAPVVTTPAAPPPPPPPPPSRTRNPWEAPTDSGFNQK